MNPGAPLPGAPEVSYQGNRPKQGLGWETAGSLSCKELSGASVLGQYLQSGKARTWLLVELAVWAYSPCPPNSHPNPQFKDGCLRGADNLGEKKDG